MGHLVRGEKDIGEILVTGPAGVKILPAASGITKLTDLAYEERLSVMTALESLEDEMDVMIIDTGAGISRNVLFFNSAAHEIVVVASPEPTSMTDAYALMKVLAREHGERRFRLLVNAVRTDDEARKVYSRLSLVAWRFLGISLDYLGCIHFDRNLQCAVTNQRAVVEMFPSSAASRCFRRVARAIDDLAVRTEPCGGTELFWKRMLRGAASEGK